MVVNKIPSADEQEKEYRQTDEHLRMRRGGKVRNVKQKAKKRKATQGKPK